MTTPNLSSSSSSHRPPPQTQIENYQRNYHTHTHQNQPVIYPYKPDKKDPPGAHQFHPVWLTIKGFFQCFLAYCDPQTYTLGFLAGAAKAGYSWAENGAPKKLQSDSEYKDFGGMAFSSSIWSQFAVIAENFAAIAIPVYVKQFFPAPSFTPLNGLTNTQNDFLRRHVELKDANPLPDYLRSGFIAYHAVMTGEEIINQLARWADVGKSRK